MGMGRCRLQQKQQLQLCRTPVVESVAAVVAADFMLAADSNDIVSIMRSFLCYFCHTFCRTTVLMNVPFTAMHFSVYEAAKKWLLHVESGDEEAEDRLSVQLVAGEASASLFVFSKPVAELILNSR
jgi:hypothetical protein